jgi:hypothetical protein
VEGSTRCAVRNCPEMRQTASVRPVRLAGTRRLSRQGRRIEYRAGSVLLGAPCERLGRGWPADLREPVRRHETTGRLITPTPNTNAMIAMTMSSTSGTGSGVELPARVRPYIDALLRTCAEDRGPLVSVILFGSAAKSGFSWGCLPALARLHLRTARENRFPLARIRSRAADSGGLE